MDAIERLKLIWSYTPGAVIERRTPDGGYDVRGVNWYSEEMLTTIPPKAAAWIKEQLGADALDGALVRDILFKLSPESNPYKGEPLVNYLRPYKRSTIGGDLYLMLSPLDMFIVVDLWGNYVARIPEEYTRAIMGVLPGIRVGEQVAVRRILRGCRKGGAR